MSSVCASRCACSTDVALWVQGLMLWAVVQVRISGREDADYGERPHGQPSSWRASGQLHVPPELVRSGRVVAVPDAGPCLAGRVIHCEDLLAANWRLKEMPKNSQVPFCSSIAPCRA